MRGDEGRSRGAQSCCARFLSCLLLWQAGTSATVSCGSACAGRGARVAALGHRQEWGGGCRSLHNAAAATVPCHTLTQVSEEQQHLAGMLLVDGACPLLEFAAHANQLTVAVGSGQVLHSTGGQGPRRGAVAAPSACVPTTTPLLHDLHGTPQGKLHAAVGFSGQRVGAQTLPAACLFPG